MSRWHVTNIATACAVLALLLAVGSSSPAQSQTQERERRRGVQCVAFSPDGRLLVATLGRRREDGRVVLWDVAKRKQLWSQRSALGVPAVAFAPDGKTLAIGGFDKTAKLLDTATGKVVKTFKAQEGYAYAVAFSPDGKTLATGGGDKSVKLWNVAAATERKSLDFPGEGVNSLSFSPDGRRLLTCSGFARVWDTATGEVKLIVGGADTFVTGALFADDHWFLAGDGNGGATLVSVATGEERARFGEERYQRIAYSPAVRRLAVAGKKLELFDFTLREPDRAEKERFAALLKKLDDDDYAVREAAGKDMHALGFVIEPELRRLMSEATSAEVRIRCRRLREAFLTKPLATLTGHTENVESLAFSRDGRLLASGSLDGSVRLWNTSEAKEIACWIPGNSAAKER